MSTQPAAGSGTALERVLALVAARPVPGRGEQHPGPDDPLTELGFDSLAMVGLMVAVEQEFAVSFPAHLITAATFRSARTIAEAVDSVVASAGPDHGQAGGNA
jgi:acyl carrier protein